MPLNHAILGLLLAIALFPAHANSTIVTKSISGPYQPEPVTVEVLTPDTMDVGRTYRVLYVLPVEPMNKTQYGAGLSEVAKANIANRYQVICVAPAFSATPWFADHPGDPALQQESHFIKTVLPWVEEHYPAERSRAGRLLLGFSKSGNGAVMLLLRHTELFDKAVAWDAPIDKTRPDQFNMIEVFGSEKHFQQYAIPVLVKQHAGKLKGDAPRIFLMSKRDGGHPMEGVHRQLRALGVPHGFEYTESIEHHWASGWVPRAAELVLGRQGTPSP